MSSESSAFSLIGICLLTSVNWLVQRLCNYICCLCNGNSFIMDIMKMIYMPILWWQLTWLSEKYLCGLLLYSLSLCLSWLYIPYHLHKLMLYFLLYLLYICYCFFRWSWYLPQYNYFDCIFLVIYWSWLSISNCYIHRVFVLYNYLDLLSILCYV